MVFYLISATKRDKGTSSRWVELASIQSKQVHVPGTLPCEAGSQHIAKQLWLGNDHGLWRLSIEAPGGGEGQGMWLQKLIGKTGNFQYWRTKETFLVDKKTN